jgi:glycosyltransferase involved in cell wall biosynthesis
MPNVFFLGNKPVGSLPSYTQYMDVCTLWYVINDYTKYIYPLKLHEYLASGRPVVGSPIPSLQEFEHVVRLARTTEEWSCALKSLIHDGDSSPKQVEARRNVAREYDWNLLTDKIARSMCQRLGKGYLGRFEQIPREYGYCTS